MPTSAQSRESPRIEPRLYLWSALKFPGPLLEKAFTLEQEKLE